ncbi:MAG: DegT/DnrJ/EryC1/StrS family aminotransferase [Candidatus Latescibacteria bacterium]|nr:DegT/DnrJ/EryC1/StrS family aminotransferase [Candidatus Latescibacterota bacterium]
MIERCFDEAELQALGEALESQNLYRGTRGNFVARFEEAMAQHLGRRYIYAVNSGTSANEAALAGLGLEPGDEVICPATAPIFVSLPVFAAGGIPVFADVDRRTLIISPEGIEARIGERTRAVVIVHLFGQPAPMDEILEVTRRHHLRVVEDCAQCYDGYHRGRKTGTIGDVACFSLQQSKHITSGEGGFIATDDSEIYKRAVLYSNAGMPWFLYGLEPSSSQPVAGVPTRGHFAFGHNHRMGELQGAVALTQLQKITTFNEVRRRLVQVIEEELRGCPGIRLAYAYPGTIPNYWLYMVQLDPERTNLTAVEVSRLCREREGTGPGYYNEVNYLESIFQQIQGRRCTPFGYPLPDDIQYQPDLCPNAEEAAKRTLFFLTHHATDPEGLRRQAAALRRTMGGLIS